MPDPELPEGTERIISDAETAGIGTDLTPSSTAGATSQPATSPTADPATSGGKSSGLRDALKGGTDKLRSSASDKAYGLLGQGIERSSSGLNNISGLIDDTAAAIDERLGSQYGDYARQAGQAVERAASELAGKDPEELVDDVRGMVRKSPGIALAGAAILGFAMVRVVKSGLESGDGGQGSTKSPKSN